MDFHKMKRKELQALCKKHKIPANLTNLEMANRLASLLKIEEERPGEQQEKPLLKSLDDMGATVDDKNCVVKQTKKVKFGSENQTFVFEKTDSRTTRLAVRRRKSMLMAEEKIDGEQISAPEDLGTLQQKTSESAAVDNQVNTRTRGRGRRSEQGGTAELELVQKKAEENDGSKKTSRRKSSSVVNYEMQSLVDGREKARDNGASEVKQVLRRSARNIARPDDYVSLTKDVDIVELPKRKTRSDCLVNQDVEKAFRRCLRRNTSKDAGEEAVDEEKEEGNRKARVTRNTRQQKREKELKETVSVTEGASVVEQHKQRISTRNATKLGLVAPGEVNGNVDLEKKIVEKSDAEVQEMGMSSSNKRLRKQENASPHGKADGQSSCADKKFSTMEDVEDLRIDVEGAPSVNMSDAGQLLNSVSKTTVIQNSLYNDSNATEDDKDENHSLDRTTSPTLLGEKSELKNAGEGSRTRNTELRKLADTVMSKEKASLTYKSSSRNTVSAKERQPENALPIRSEGGVLLDFCSSDGKIMKDDSKEADADKQAQYKEADIPNRDSSEVAEIMLIPSSVLKSSSLRVISTVSRSFTEDNKTEMESPVLDNSCVQCDSPITSTSFDKFTGISLLVCEPDFQGKNQPQDKTATPNLLPEECESNNAAREGSSIKNTELEGHTPLADLSNDQVQLTWKSSTTNSITAKEKQSGDALLMSREEGIILVGHLEDQATKDEEINDLKSYPARLEFESAAQSCPSIPNDPIIPQVEKCFDHLDAHESCDNVESIEAAIGVTQTTMVDENPEGMGISVSESNHTAGSEGCQKQRFMTESNPQLTLHEDTYGIASLFQLETYTVSSHKNIGIKTVENGKDSVSDYLEGQNTAVSDVLLNNNHEDAVLAEQNLEVYEEEGKSCRETNEIRERLNGAAVCLEGAGLTGRSESSTSNDLVSSDVDGESATKVQKVSNSVYFDNKPELVTGFEEHGELNYANYRDFEFTSQQSALILRGDAFRSEAGEDHRTLESSLTEIYCGFIEENTVNVKHVADEQIRIHGFGYRDYSVSDSQVCLENDFKEQKDAVTPSVHFLGPCQLESADTSNTMCYKLPQEVSGKVAHLVEDNMATASEAVQDGVTPNCNSPEPEVSEPKDLIHLMHQEEHENIARAEAAPFLLDGSEENLVLHSSVKQARVNDEYAKCHDSGATIELTAPSPEAPSPNKELYPAEHTQLEEDFLGHENLDRISERIGEEKGTGELSGEIARCQNDSQLCHPGNRENFTLTTDSEDAEEKEHNEAKILYGHSLEDAENVLPCSSGLTYSPLKEAQGLTPNANVDETFERVGSSASDGLDDIAGSTGSHKQGLAKESNVQLSEHDESNFSDLERKLEPCLSKESTQRSAMVLENSSSRDFELVDFGNVLFMSEEAGEVDYLTSETRAETSLLINKVDGRDKNEQAIGTEQEAGDQIDKQVCEFDEFTVWNSLCDTDESLYQKDAVPTVHFLEPCQAKHEEVSQPEHCAFEELTGIFEHVLEDENASINQDNKDVFEAFKDKELLTASLNSMDKIYFTAGTLEVSNGGIEDQLTASFPEMRSMTPEYNEYRTADVKGISREDVFKGSKQEVLIRTVVEGDPTAIMGSENTEVTAELHSSVSESSHPLEVDLKEHTCADEDVHENKNTENTDFELARLETADDTNRYEAGDLKPVASETSLLTSGKDARDMEAGMISIEQIADEQIEKQGCDCSGFAALSSLVCHEDASKLPEEVAGPNSHSPETCQAEHEERSHPEPCTTFEETTPDVFHEEMPTVEHEDTSHPEHSITFEFVTGTAQCLESENGSVNQAIEGIFQGLKEDEVCVSSVEETRFTVENLECCNGELEVQLTVPHPEISTTIIDDENKTSDVKGISNEDRMIPPPEIKPVNDETGDGEMQKVNKSSRKPTSLMNQKERSILIHGTPRRPIKTADMKENNTGYVKREHLADATALRPLARRKALGELHRK